ncbi:hypothetical protein HRI_004187100 [Hibiscus trionum]|uniref:Uncharacterized protein n=1 Tax=Hibiscus trionum TaxID=183268 RepID=A0A9W7J1I5_HIBTR|nr:hypothetical protein HRI_004187100 [Hibiscus trionum]
MIEHKYEIVKRLQERKHICGMTGDGVNDAPALKKADIEIAVADATDAVRSASDIVLTEPGLSVIISAVLTSRAIFQRMKNYTIYVVSITIRIMFGFMFIALIWKFDFAPFMVLIIAILNDGERSFIRMLLQYVYVKATRKPTIVLHLIYFIITHIYKFDFATDVPQMHEPNTSIVFTVISKPRKEIYPLFFLIFP